MSPVTRLKISAISFLNTAPLMWDFDQEPAALIQNGLNDRVMNTRTVHRAAKLIHADVLLETNSDYRSAFKIDSEVKGVAPAGMKFVAIKRGAHAREH